MALKLTYAIHFVADMDRAVAFYRDTLGLTLKFASPGWSEFVDRRNDAGAASGVAENPAGSTHLGFGTPDVHAFHHALTAAGVRFSRRRNRCTA